MRAKQPVKRGAKRRRLLTAVERYLWAFNGVGDGHTQMIKGLRDYTRALEREIGRLRAELDAPADSCVVDLSKVRRQVRRSG